MGLFDKTAIRFKLPRVATVAVLLLGIRFSSSAALAAVNLPPDAVPAIAGLLQAYDVGLSAFILLVFLLAAVSRDRPETNRTTLVILAFQASIFLLWMYSLGGGDPACCEGPLRDPRSGCDRRGIRCLLARVARARAQGGRLGAVGLPELPRHGAGRLPDTQSRRPRRGHLYRTERDRGRELVPRERTDDPPGAPRPRRMGEPRPGRGTFPAASPMVRAPPVRGRPGLPDRPHPEPVLGVHPLRAHHGGSNLALFPPSLVSVALAVGAVSSYLSAFLLLGRKANPRRWDLLLLGTATTVLAGFYVSMVSVEGLSVGLLLTALASSDDCG